MLTILVCAAALCLVLPGQLTPPGSSGNPALQPAPFRRAMTRSMVAQAGQRLDLPLPAGVAVSGSLAAPLLTGGAAISFGALSELEFDSSSGRLSLRIPPREPGPITIRWTAPGPPASSGSGPAPGPVLGLLTVRVLPPNLRDGIRVDGTVDAFESELLAGHSLTVSSTVPMFDLTTLQPSGLEALQYTLALDSRSLYLAFRWTDASEDRGFDLNVDIVPQQVDALAIQFDANGDGAYDLGDDSRTVLSFLTGSGSLDSHTIGPGGPDVDDSSPHGVARMDYDPASLSWTAEFVLPRAPDAAGEDADFSGPIGLPFNVVLQDGIGAAAAAPRGGALFGFTGADASGWGQLPQAPMMVAESAPVVTPSAGTLICISTHDDPLGELYEMDLPTGSLTRLTFNNRLEDWVSVAPDGSWAAYGSTTDPNDILGYEIYTWDRATGQETALTNDSTLDGHPAISPDGTRLAFVTFTSGFNSDIQLMDRDGGNRIAVTATPSISENDPEWTKDGRLVIKSTQWTGQDLLGVIDLSGTVLSQLTMHAFSDHDGFVSADNSWVLYERFETVGRFGADKNLVNSTPWSVRMVSVDGSRERLLVNDGLVNWLPVEGPGGTLVFFSNTSFNGLELRMTDRFGTDLGRLAPQQGRIRYMDWK